MKPIVYFSERQIIINQNWVIAHNHPKFPEKTDVRTSSVLYEYGDGSFETLNTIYVPKNKKTSGKSEAETTALCRNKIQGEDHSNSI